jgi:hypothetical protein
MSTDAVADTPDATTSTTTTGVKIATPDLFIFKDEVVPIETMTDLIFEDIGGHELITISRNDIIAGQNVSYQPIKNLSNLYLQYNPQNIVGLQDTSDTFFKNYTIKFESSIPESGTGPNGEIVYIDPDSGDLVINVTNLDSYEQVEVQVLTGWTRFNDTIYEVNN